MNIWGKVIGGAAGFAIGGPIGALLGAVAGHAIDTKILPSYISNDENYKSIVFTAGVIALSAKMAKADGKVTKEEILTFRKLVQIPKDDINQVSKLWELAKETTDGYELYAKQIYSLFRNQPEILERILDILFEIAKSDGNIDSTELNYLKNVSNIFNFDEIIFEKLLALHNPENNSFEILGVQISDTLEDIQKKWKEMVKNNHPDKLVGQGMPIEFIESANQKLAIINSAYEEIKSLRT
ncbi:MAG: TerB family tellurite resistance protein [Candidatus Puniceispirillales bacterium]